MALGMTQKLLRGGIVLPHYRGTKSSVKTPMKDSPGRGAGGLQGTPKGYKDLHLIQVYSASQELAPVSVALSRMRVSPLRSDHL